MVTKKFFFAVSFLGASLLGYLFLLPNNIRALCSGTCGNPGGVCGQTTTCPDGSRQFWYCEVPQNATSGNCCTTNNCSSGGATSPPNYSPPNACSNIGLVMICGSPVLACKNSVGGCFGSPGSPADNPDCNASQVGCNVNCWCESPNPKGWFDSASCTQASGWACDANQFSSPLIVNFFTDPGLTNMFASIYANQSRPDVASSCGGYSLHGFNFAMPQIFNDGVAHNIYAVAQNIGDGANSLLGGSPKVITCAPPPPPAAPIWWQVKDADVAANGDLKSVPSGANLFDVAGAGGFPGIPQFSSTGVTNLTSANVSTKHWIVSSSAFESKIFNSQYFANQIPSGTTINNISLTSITNSDLAAGGVMDAATGYYWYKYDGAAASGSPLTIGGNITLGSRKVILLVNNANLIINGNINLTKGSGFFMTIVSGNISVGTVVGGGGAANLEGIYEADGTFTDGTLQPGSNDAKLWIRGSVVAYSGATLQRNIGGAASTTDPSEFFEYAPDQIMLYPKKLGDRKLNWKEVAP